MRLVCILLVHTYRRGVGSLAFWKSAKLPAYSGGRFTQQGLAREGWPPVSSLL